MDQALMQLAAQTEEVLLAGLDEKALRDDPGVGLDGLLEMIEAWLEVSNLENFIRAARALWQRARAGRTNGGSNG